MREAVPARPRAGARPRPRPTSFDAQYATGDGRLRRRLRASSGTTERSADGLLRRPRSPVLLEPRRPVRRCSTASSSSAHGGDRLRTTCLLGDGTRRRPRSTTRSRRAASADLPTIFDRLQAAGITWKFYVQNYDPTITLPHAGRAATAASQVVLRAAARVPALRRRPGARSRTSSTCAVLRDLQRGTLPAVSYIVPAGLERAPAQQRPGRPDASSARIVAGLMRQPDVASRPRSCGPTTTGAAGTTTSRRRRSTPRLRLPGAGAAREPYARRGYVDHTRSTPRRSCGSSRTTGASRHSPA